jgi:hypothetical protein
MTGDDLYTILSRYERRSQLGNSRCFQYAGETQSSFVARVRRKTFGPIFKELVIEEGPPG